MPDSGRAGAGPPAGADAVTRAAATGGSPVVAVPLRGDPRPMRLGLAAMLGIRETRTVHAFKQHCRDSITPAGVPGMPQPQE